MWKNDSSQLTFWSETHVLQPTETITLTKGSPIGLLLALTQAQTQTVTENVWSDNSSIQTTWTNS